MAKKELEATQNANEAKLMALKAAMSKIEKEQDSKHFGDSVSYYLLRYHSSFH